MDIIDLRSDTVTKPSVEMRAAMASAQVGDDVFMEDPSILELEQKICEMFGTEMALFTPTATMSNQIALKILTHPLDEIICDRTAHIYSYEVGGYAFHSGCSIRYVEGDRGVFSAIDVIKQINPDDVHKPITRVVSIENTVNRGGGRIYPIETIAEIAAVCREKGLSFHLDGSRLFNALVASGADAKQFGELFDTITLCFSKGLGCPAGSILTGKAIHLQKARRVRKVMGGGMRQAGVLAAAGLYALEHNISRLAEDHQRAAETGNALNKLSYVESVLPVETNIVIFRLRENISDEKFIQYLNHLGIKAFAIGDNWVRFVFHLDIISGMEEKIASALINFNA